MAELTVGDALSGKRKQYSPIAVGSKRVAEVVAAVHMHPHQVTNPMKAS